MLYLKWFKLRFIPYIPSSVIFNGVWGDIYECMYVDSSIRNAPTRALHNFDEMQAKIIQ